MPPGKVSQCHTESEILLFFGMCAPTPGQSMLRQLIRTKVRFAESLQTQGAL